MMKMTMLMIPTMFLSPFSITLFQFPMFQKVIQALETGRDEGDDLLEELVAERGGGVELEGGRKV